MTALLRSLAVLVLVGCTLVATAPPAARGQEASTWQAIQERGSLRVGATQAPPWYFKDPQSEAWSGLGISVGSAMAETLGVELEVVEVTWGNAIAALQADKIDTMFVLDATPQRAMAVDFPAAPLLYYALAVIVDDAMAVETWDDLNKPEVTIAVTQGTTIEAYVKAHCGDANILSFPTNSENVAAFQSGRADAASLFHPPLIALQKKMGRGKIVVPHPIRASASSAAVRREADKTWRDWVSTALAYYYDTNQTQVWYEEFLADFGVDPKAVPPIRKDLW